MVKLLFVAGSLRPGGIERSLVNLLKHIDYDNYRVDLFLYSSYGQYLREIPKDVNLLPNSKTLYPLGLTMEEAKSTGKLSIYLWRITAAILCRFFGSKRFWSIIFRKVPKLTGYDVAIAFSHNSSNKNLYSGFYQFVLDRIEASKKVGWVHSDYKAMGLPPRQDRVFFERLDKIVNVSYSCKDSFDQVFPCYMDKSYVVYNTIPIAEVRNMSMEEVSLPLSLTDGMVGATVARLDKNKAVHRVIRAVARLYQEGIDVKWIIIGDGPERGTLEELAYELGVKDIIYFLGIQANPYPYIKKADLVALTSHYEGMPMTVYEALVLQTPVLVTEYKAAHEQIGHGYNGIVVDNSDEGVYMGLKNLVTKPQLIETMKKNLTEDSFDNSKSLEQFYQVIG